MTNYMDQFTRILQEDVEGWAEELEVDPDEIIVIEQRVRLIKTEECWNYPFRRYRSLVKLKWRDYTRDQEGMYVWDPPPSDSAPDAARLGFRDGSEETEETEGGESD